MAAPGRYTLALARAQSAGGCALFIWVALSFSVVAILPSSGRGSERRPGAGVATTRRPFLFAVNLFSRIMRGEGCASRQRRCRLSSLPCRCGAWESYTPARLHASAFCFRKFSTYVSTSASVNRMSRLLSLRPCSLPSLKYRRIVSAPTPSNSATCVTVSNRVTRHHPPFDNFNNDTYQ